MSVGPATLPPLPDLIPIAALLLDHSRQHRNRCTDKSPPLDNNNCRNNDQGARNESGRDQVGVVDVGEQRPRLPRPTAQPAPDPIDSAGVSRGRAVAAAAAAAAPLHLHSGHPRKSRSGRVRSKRRKSRHRHHHHHHHRNSDDAGTGKNQHQHQQHQQQQLLHHRSRREAEESEEEEEEGRSAAKRTNSESSRSGSSPPPLPPAPPRVRPIFVWIRQEDQRIVDVKCEDYDKRNRILLTKTPQGWRAIPRTETLVPGLRATDRTGQQQQQDINNTNSVNREEDSSKPPHHHTHHHHHHHHHSHATNNTLEEENDDPEEGLTPDHPHHHHHRPRKSASRKGNKVRRKSASVQVTMDSSPNHSSDDDDDNDRDEPATPPPPPSGVADAPHCYYSPPTSPSGGLWSRPVNVESHLPSHRIHRMTDPSLWQREEEEEEHQRGHHSGSASPEPPDPPTTASPSPHSSDEPALLLSLAASTSSSATPPTTTPEGGAAENSGAKSELGGGGGDALQLVSSPLDNLLAVAEFEFNEFNQQQKLEEKKTTEAMVDDAIEGIEDCGEEGAEEGTEEGAEEEAEEGPGEDLNTLIEAACVSAGSAEAEADDEMAGESNTDRAHPDDYDYTEDDDNNIAMDDILTRLEQSLRSPEGSEPVPVSVPVAKEVVREAEEPAEVPATQEDIIPEEEVEEAEEEEADEEDEEEEAKEPTDLTKHTLAKSEAASEGVKAPEEELFDPPSAPTDLSLKLPPLSSRTPEAEVAETEAILRDMEEEEEDMEDMELPTDLSIRKSPPRSPSLSEAIQSPQPSGIPAVPPSPDTVSVGSDCPNKSRFLETLLTSSSTAVAPSAQAQKEPLDLGGKSARKSASPTVTCSEEVEEAPPPHKKNKTEDITLRTLLDQKADKQPQSETPKLLELLKPSPITQLKQVLCDASVNVPDPLLVPKERLSQIISNPATEIAALLKQRPELRLPEALAFPHLLQDPDILVITLEQLETIVVKQNQLQTVPSVLSSSSTKGNSSDQQQQQQQHHQQHHPQQHPPQHSAATKKEASSSSGGGNNSGRSGGSNERQTLASSVRNSGSHSNSNHTHRGARSAGSSNRPSNRGHGNSNSNNNHNSDFEGVASSTVGMGGMGGIGGGGAGGGFNPMLWLPYLNQIESMANPGKFGLQPANYHQPTPRFPPPLGFSALQQAPIGGGGGGYGSANSSNNNCLELSMWQEALMQANLLRASSQKNQQQQQQHELFASANLFQSPSVAASFKQQQQNQKVFSNSSSSGSSGLQYHRPDYAALYENSLLNLPGMYGLKQQQQNHSSSSAAMFLDSKQVSSSHHSSHSSGSLLAKQKQLLEQQSQQMAGVFGGSTSRSLSDHPYHHKQQQQQSQSSFSSRGSGKSSGGHLQQQQQNHHSHPTQRRGASSSGGAGSGASNAMDFVTKPHGQPIDLSGPLPKMKQSSDASGGGSGKFLSPEDVAEVGSTTASVEEMQDAHKYLWHPLFGTQKEYNPWTCNGKLATTGD